ncbi:MAG: hypothetical protein H6743_02430 [Rickettsiaceae bacterium]|nr:hypothetical protein [Rickettsiaceae bacterium]
MEVGKDTVIIGSVPQNLKAGNGSVIIGQTDANGNTILNGSMAVGRGAKAGAGSIAIGAEAAANTKLEGNQSILQKIFKAVVGWGFSCFFRLS